MKFRTTKKEIKYNYKKIYSVGYCNLQTLLSIKNPFAYSAGVYGWACDYFEIDNVIISTGYSPIGIKISYDLLQKYEIKAQKIKYNYDLDWATVENELNQLLKELLQEVKNGQI